MNKPKFPDLPQLVPGKMRSIFFGIEAYHGLMEVNEAKPKDKACVAAGQAGKLTGIPLGEEAGTIVATAFGFLTEGIVLPEAPLIIAAGGTIGGFIGETAGKGVCEATPVIENELEHYWKSRI